MPQANQTKTLKSRCNFCGSTDYGKGCKYGPQGVHLHADDPLRCSFCGSTDYGRGCRLNPSSNIHVRGATYNNMYKETLQSFLNSKILIKEIKKPYTEFECYRYKIIDKDGNKIKNPSTVEEHASYCSLTRTILKIKRFLGSKIDLIETVNDLQTTSTVINENKEHYKKILEYKEKIDNITQQLYKTIDEAQMDGISLTELNPVLNT